MPNDRDRDRDRERDRDRDRYRAPQPASPRLSQQQQQQPSNRNSSTTLPDRSRVALGGQGQQRDSYAGRQPGRTGSYSSNTGGRYGDRYDDRERDRDTDRDRDRGGQGNYRHDRTSSASGVWSAAPPSGAQGQFAETDALWPMFRAVDKDSKFAHISLSVPDQTNWYGGFKRRQSAGCRDRT